MREATAVAYDWSPEPESWREQAACSGAPLDVFFPPPSGPGQYDAARVICSGCPVKSDCLDDALTHGFAWRDDGFRGGMTPRERDRLRGRLRATKQRFCRRCGSRFAAHRVALYCSEDCRNDVRAERMRRSRA